MNDEQRYSLQQEKEEAWFEAVCLCCGKCCGAFDDDPCAQLAYNDATKKYYCKVYPDRLGPQKTLSGKSFTCIPIRLLIQQKTLREGCAYQK